MILMPAPCEFLKTLLRNLGFQKMWNHQFEPKYLDFKGQKSPQMMSVTHLTFLSPCLAWKILWIRHYLSSSLRVPGTWQVPQTLSNKWWYEIRTCGLLFSPTAEWPSLFEQLLNVSHLLPSHLWSGVVILPLHSVLMVIKLRRIWISFQKLRGTEM